MTNRLDGRRAIITGAASGIGFASASLFALEGAQVLAVDLPGKGLTAHPGVIPLECDIASDEAPERIVAAAVSQLGGLDILFNNAGVSGRARVEELSDADW